MRRTWERLTLTLATLQRAPVFPLYPALNPFQTDKCQIGPSWCAFNSPYCNPQWCALPPLPPQQADLGGSGSGSGSATSGLVDVAGSSGDASGLLGWAPATYRQYNFPHQTAVYFALYLAARNGDPTQLPTKQPYTFYLNAAFQTAITASCPRADGSGYDCAVSVGLMDGTIWRELLLALEAEGAAWATQAATLRALMQARVFGGFGLEGWLNADNPAGSEFAYDTTGQEEVAIWGAFFNASSDGWQRGELNNRMVDSILGYMGAVPTWAYHGAAVGFCDGR